jgi:hypothetical protein
VIDASARDRRQLAWHVAVSETGDQGAVPWRTERETGVPISAIATAPANGDDRGIDEEAT